MLFYVYTVRFRPTGRCEGGLISYLLKKSPFLRVIYRRDDLTEVLSRSFCPIERHHDASCSKQEETAITVDFPTVMAVSPTLFVL